MSTCLSPLFFTLSYLIFLKLINQISSNKPFLVVPDTFLLHEGVSSERLDGKQETIYLWEHNETSSGCFTPSWFSSPFCPGSSHSTPHPPHLHVLYRLTSFYLPLSTSLFPLPVSVPVHPLFHLPIPCFQSLLAACRWEAFVGGQRSRWPWQCAVIVLIKLPHLR